MQVRPNRTRSGLTIKRRSQELCEIAHFADWIGNEIDIVDREESHFGESSELSVDAVKMRGIGVGELLFVQFCAAAALPSKHGFLRSDDFGQIAFHEDDLIMFVCRKVREQLGDDFHDFAASLLEPRCVFGEFDGFLEFEIADGVVFVGGAF